MWWTKSTFNPFLLQDCKTKITMSGFCFPSIARLCYVRKLPVYRRYVCRKSPPLQGTIACTARCDFNGLYPTATTTTTTTTTRGFASISSAPSTVWSDFSSSSVQKRCQWALAWVVLMFCGARVSRIDWMSCMD